MTITIIGGSGFVGTRLTKRLLESGHTVKIADKRKSVAYPDLWTRVDIRNSADEKNEFPASLTDEAMAPGADEIAKKAQPMHTLLEALQGSDAVINLAAEHRDDVTPKSLYDDVNVHGSAHVLEACTKLKIHRVVFTSSVAVYGFAPVGTDESGKIAYFNDYGRTKYAAEQEYKKWLESDKNNSVTIIRPTVIFGEQNRGNVYNLLRQIASGRFPMVGKGTNRKSMNYVENVAAFLQFCVENMEKNPEILRSAQNDGNLNQNDIAEAKQMLKQVQHDRHSELVSESSSGNLYLFNYCDEPAYDMNHLVLDVYKHLGKPKKRLFHFPFWLAYFGGKCFDLAAFILHKKFTINSIRVKKFTQNTYFKSSRVPKTGFKAPVELEEGLRRTIDYEFVKKTQGHVFHCE